MDEKILILFSKTRLFKAKSLGFTYKFALEFRGAHIILLCASIILIFRQPFFSFICLTISFILYILPQITKNALRRMGQQAKENLKSLEDLNIGQHSDYLLLKIIKRNLNLAMLVINAILLFFVSTRNHR